MREGRRTTVTPSPFTHERGGAPPDAARAGHGDLWVLCPVEDPGVLPRLDGEVVRVGDNEWIALPDASASNPYRSTPLHT